MKIRYNSRLRADNSHVGVEALLPDGSIRNLSDTVRHHPDDWVAMPSRYNWADPVVSVFRPVPKLGHAIQLHVGTEWQECPPEIEEYLLQ